MKANRQAKILELITQYEIETQTQLSERLRQSGITVTQATVSRDIRELSLTKVPTAFGGSKYAPLHEQQLDLSGKYERVFKEGFVSLDTAQNLVVIKTVSGMAMAVAAALDSLHFEEIIGSIAGDDTILSATKSNEKAELLAGKLRGIARQS